jgi:hypothetical protein
LAHERAYRAGRLVCGYVHVTVSLDERLEQEHERRREAGLRRQREVRRER